ncbi:MAG TPA: ABC transporter substrate-binding protein [Thermoanaerobaculia bacterium]|nr:ABC transporter substrate-binding protein [Thermoanaerobaculia bacterium]
MKSTFSWTARVLAPVVLLCAVGCAPHAETRVLAVVQSSDITTLDPNRSFEVVNDIVAMNIFDPLFRFDRHMTLQPSLAVRWENPTDRTWLLHLRPGVRFHDGVPLTSEDVVFTLRRVLAHPESELFPFLSGVRAIDAPDPETVQIQTEQPTPLLARLSFVYILPARRMAREGDAEFFRHPVGTGPYRFLAWKPGDRVEVGAWNGYWGGAPAVARAAFRSVEKPEARWTLVAREHPTVLLEGPRQGWEQHRSDRDLRLIARPSLTVSYLGVNVAPRPDNPLADRRVREAIRLAIDLKELLREGASNHGFPASQFVPPDVIGYNPAIPLPPHDPARARALLAEAGHPDGLDLALDIQAETATPLVQNLVRQAGAAAIRVTPKFWPKEEFFDRIDKGVSQFHLTGWVCTSGESAELFESSLHTRGSAGALGRDNGTGYSNPELDRLIEQLVATIDPGARVDLEKRAMAIAVADLPYIPLYVQEDRYVLTTDVAWEPRADGEIFLPEVRLR